MACDVTLETANNVVSFAPAAVLRDLDEAAALLSQRYREYRQALIEALKRQRLLSEAATDEGHDGDI